MQAEGALPKLDATRREHLLTGWCPLPGAPFSPTHTSPAHLLCTSPAALGRRHAHQPLRLKLRQAGRHSWVRQQLRHGDALGGVLLQHRRQQPSKLTAVVLRQRGLYTKQHLRRQR